MNIKRPSTDQMREFKCSTLFLGSLNKPPAEDSEFAMDVQEAKQHPVFLWLHGHPAFHRAWEQIEKKDGYKKSLDNMVHEDWLLMQFSGTVAEYFADYLDACAGRLMPNVITNSERESALKPIRELQKLIAKGINFRDARKTNQLLNLLNSLSQEIEGGTPSRIPKRKSEKLPQRILIQQLAENFYFSFGEYCSTAIIELLGIVDSCGVNEKDVQREIQHVKEVLAFSDQSKRRTEK